ncbi:acyl carrier protein [Acerihabitans sp. TG2]|uniref:acyl carrier protein n=1 Tax=Acerihabitans sp. TG2 TaxID=3096008 RepID=UPI002B23ABAB|nr:acyl carrier protein [Acerihabitans sp. TG2]MEA9391678.1 acyl carrier protein [Acerihabitans sp. TG2]
MSVNLETVARQKLAAVLASPAEIGQLDVGANMRDAYGLTSLNKILFITSLCQAAGISLTGLTEDDLAHMNTLDDVIRILTPLVDTPAANHLQGA